MYHYANSCVTTAPDDVPSLIDMINNERRVSRRTFLQHVDREEMADIEKQLGYESHSKQGLTMAGDWAVSYHRSKWKGKRCYYFRWSAIEYYFLGTSQESQLRPLEGSCQSFTRGR